MSSFPQVVLCIATAGKSGVLMRAWLEGLIILVRQSPGILALSSLPDRNCLPRAGPQLADCDMVPLDSNAVRNNVDDRLSIPEIRQMELDSERHPQITP
jgi:hypothetical protein